MAIGSKDLAVTELDGFDNDRLAAELEKAKQELFNLRFQSATGQLWSSNPSPTAFARASVTEPDRSIVLSPMSVIKLARVLPVKKDSRLRHAQRRCEQFQPPLQHAIFQSRKPVRNGQFQPDLVCLY